MLISEESFLRRIPSCLDAKTKVIYHSIAHCISSIDINYQRIKTILSGEIGNSSPNIDYHSRINLFSTAWSVIDHAHMLRQIFLTFQSPRKEIYENFINFTKDVSKLRNKMDHLHNNVNNIARSKDVVDPLFGSFQWYALKFDGVSSIENVTGYYVTTYWSAGQIHDKHKANLGRCLAEGEQVEFPFGRFVLSAFDIEINISKLYFELSDIVNHFNLNVRESIEGLIRKEAAERGISPDEEIGKHTGYMNFFVEMTIIS